MANFDFLSGMTGPNANALSAAPAQQYQQLWNTGSPQGMNYGQILGGGQASPATQGLDFGGIGQWALKQNQYMGQGNQTPALAQALQSIGASPQQGDQPWAIPQQAPGRAGMQLGQVQQGNPGYIGQNVRSGLLGMMR